MPISDLLAPVDAPSTATLPPQPRREPQTGDSPSSYRTRLVRSLKLHEGADDEQNNQVSAENGLPLAEVTEAEGQSGVATPVDAVPRELPPASLAFVLPADDEATLEAARVDIALSLPSVSPISRFASVESIPLSPPETQLTALESACECADGETLDPALDEEVALDPAHLLDVSAATPQLPALPALELDDAFMAGVTGKPPAGLRPSMYALTPNVGPQPASDTIAVEQTFPLPPAGFVSAIAEPAILPARELPPAFVGATQFKVQVEPPRSNAAQQPVAIEVSVEAPNSAPTPLLNARSENVEVGTELPAPPVNSTDVPAMVPTSAAATIPPESNLKPATAAVVDVALQVDEEATVAPGPQTALPPDDGGATPAEKTAESAQDPQSTQTASKGSGESGPTAEEPVATAGAATTAPKGNRIPHPPASLSAPPPQPLLADVPAPGGDDEPAATVSSTASPDMTAAGTSPQPRSENASPVSVVPAGQGRPEVDPAELVARIAGALREAHDSGRQLRMRLNPPELGALQIEVSLRGGSVSARLDVQTAAAHQTILEHLPLLHEALAQHGTTLDRIDVQIARHGYEDSGAESRGEQGQQFEQQQSGGQQERQPQPEPERDEAPEPRNFPAGRTQLDELDIQI